VRERLERVRDRTGLIHLLALLQFGGMPDEFAIRNMAPFASGVMPKLR